MIFTKHVKQNVKTWEDGMASYSPHNKKFALWTRTGRIRNVEQIFFSIVPDFSPGDEITMKKHIV